MQGTISRGASRRSRRCPAAIARTMSLVAFAAITASCGGSTQPPEAPAATEESARLCSAYMSTGACPGCSQSIRVLIENDVSGAYRLQRVRVMLDHMVLCQTEEASVGEYAVIPTGLAQVPPGDHEIEVELEFAGNGYGVFAYLKGYRFSVSGQHSIEHPAEGSVVVRATASEGGTATTPLQDRLKLSFTEDGARQGS
jgi:hypothetical protein